MGLAGKGKIAGATRQDYAAAAAAVLSHQYTGGVNKVYELAGDEAFTCDDLAAEASKYTDSPIKHQVMPTDEYVKTLVGFGLPEEFCQILAVGQPLPKVECYLIVPGRTWTCRPIRTTPYRITRTTSLNLLDGTPLRGRGL